MYCAFETVPESSIAKRNAISSDPTFKNLTSTEFITAIELIAICTFLPKTVQCGFGYSKIPDRYPEARNVSRCTMIPSAWSGLPSGRASLMVRRV